MLIKKILSTEIQLFINKEKSNKITDIILKGSPFEGVSIQDLANQIASKQKSEYKLPTWYHCENIYYPQKISIEQTSSEVTAKYKSDLILGKSIIDITGGFGVDCYYFSKVFDKVIHCEINEELSEIVKHNNTVLGVNNIETIAQNGIEFLKNTNQKFDYIYIDPSRRNDVKGKVFLLKDCLPNVPEHLDLLFSKSDKILIKNSPMLDISSGINELKFVKEITVVAVNNEVKELLFLLEKNYENNIKIKTINISKKGNQTFDFEYKSNSIPKYSLPLNYLYEPNVAILKSGGFNQLSEQLSVAKLHQHSHLYTSENLIDFTGRCFKIQEVMSYDKKRLKKLIPNKKANITTRNFPKSVAQIRKETGLKDGGDLYLFFTKNIDDKNIVIVCKTIV